MVNFVNVEEKINSIEEIEHKCDGHVHKVLEQLNRSFITPIDREDIYLIAKELDNITDSIEATAHRFLMFHVKEARNEAKKLAAMIKQCAEALQKVMQEMKSMKTSKTLNGYIIEVNRIEDEGDRVFRKSISDLFSDEANPIEVTKWLEIYNYL
jgi:predicted phosphate transport protein (TIGR00153 family)